MLKGKRADADSSLMTLACENGGIAALPEGFISVGGTALRLGWLLAMSLVAACKMAQMFVGFHARGVVLLEVRSRGMRCDPQDRGET